MKAYMIDAHEKRVYDILISGVENIASALRRARYYQIAHVFQNGDTVFVDEEGFLKPQTAYFRIRGYDAIFAGDGVAVGPENTGYDVQRSINDVRAQVEWLTRAQVVAELRGKPAMTITSFSSDGQEHQEVIQTWDDLLEESDPAGRERSA